jgi:hypothetical protein
MRKIILFVFILFSAIQLNAQELLFSDSAVVSLLTCSPGEEAYAKFGHTAIRIKDKTTKTDVVFNYGIFSFDTDNFYYKFVKGETDYLLGVYSTNYFLPEYALRNSMVWEQELNLDIPEKRNLINMLLKNYEPENRMYRYNFIFDNCATRPRDKVVGALHGYVRFEPTSDSRTFRQWVGAYVGFDSWLKFGIDLVFGLDADRFAKQSESMFLPEVLMSEFQTAQIVTKNGDNRKLVSERKVLVDKVAESEVKTYLALKPIGISMAVLILGIFLTLWDTKRKRHYKLFDTVLLALTGLAGLIVAYLMFFSLHPLVKQNLNILWLNPLNLIVAVLIWIRPARTVLFFYQMFNILLLVIALLAFALSIQDMNVAFFPIIVVMIMRATSWFAITKRKLFKGSGLRSLIRS